MKSHYKYFVDDDPINLDDFIDEDLDYDEEMVNADETPPTKNVIAQPFIIKIRNTTASPISNVVVLGANVNLNYGGSVPGSTNYGNPSGITISMGISGITYAELLFQTVTQPFTVGYTYIHTNVSQVFETFSLQHKDANGNLVQKNLIPILDPYQKITRTVPIEDIYTIDGNAMFTFSQVRNGVTIRLYLYPTEKINIRKILDNQNPAELYAKPIMSYSSKITTVSKSVLDILNEKK